MHIKYSRVLKHVYVLTTNDGAVLSSYIRTKLFDENLGDSLTATCVVLVQGYQFTRRQEFPLRNAMKLRIFEIIKE